MELESFGDKMIKRIKRPKKEIDIQSLSNKELKELIILIAKKLGLKFQEEDI